MKRLTALLGTPVWLVVGAGLIVLVNNFLIMLLINALHSTSGSRGASFWDFFDPIVLAALVSATLYVFIFKPISKQQIKLERQPDMLHHNEQLAVLIEAIPDAVFLKDGEGRWLVINQPAEQLFQLNDIPWQGKTERELADLHPAFRAAHEGCMASDEKAWQAGRLQVDEENVAGEDGRCTIIEARKMPMFDEAGRRKGLVIIGRDITERKASEARIERLTKLYRALSEVNQAIVRMDDASTLFPLVCRMAVDFGGIRMAWIGQLNEANGLIEPVVSYGNGIEYLNEIVISSKEDATEGRGPVGTAFRENRNVIVNDFQTNELTAPWHELALRYDWGSGGFFPIRRAGKVFVVFNVYHSHSGAFDAEMIGLLDEMSRDISFALDSFDRENERGQTQSALLGSERHFRAYFERSMVGMAATSLEKGWLEVNDALCQMLGYSREELMRLSWTELTHPDDLAANETLFDRMLRGEIDEYALDKRFIRKDGTIIYVHIAVRGVRKATGDLDYVVSLVENITERKKTEDMLILLGRILDDSSNELYMFDAQTLHFILVNAGAQRNLGYTIDELRALTPLDLKPKLKPEIFERLIAPLRLGEVDNVVFEAEHQRKDKSFYPVEIRLHLSTKEVIPVFVAIIQDITERKQAMQELRITATAFETQEGIMITDRDTRILRVNAAFTRLTGYSAAEAIGQTPAMLKSGRQNEAFYRSMWETLARDKYWQGEIWNRRKNGKIYPEWQTITVVTDEDGQVTNYVGVSSDLTPRKEADERIHELAFYDPLTNLPNRRLLRDRLQQAMTASLRSQRGGAVLFIDLDNFKVLNDIRGHDIGDLLLIEVAERLHDCVRSNDTIARLGGDEFVVILEDLSEDAQEAVTLAQGVGKKILATISRPFDLHGIEYHGSSSIGISLFRSDEISSMDDLLKHADVAMYQAKTSGRNTMYFFDPVMQAKLEMHATLTDDLRQALPQQQLKLYYQVQVDEHGVVGAEALLRWRHPERGLVSPLEFIPLAEESGLIVPIGQWVLQTACAQLKQWESDPRTRHLQLAVNVSARQFRQPDLIEQVLEVLNKSGIDPLKLKFELTESLVLDNIADSIDKMQVLRSIGIRFSLDDFGTGQSSLAYLKRLPLDQIKIDQSFVRDIITDPNDAAIVQTIIGMANNLGLNVIAEGVETEQQRDFLERNGCRAYQGYLFGKPVPIEEFQDLVFREA
ncbi:MAG: PAS domain S-box protein [Betaproteobacteria bacterium]|nr:PAS domain S-box protein [Betaproteobacteria bacterium]